MGRTRESAEPIRLPWRIVGKLDLVPVAVAGAVWTFAFLGTTGGDPILIMTLGIPALSAFWLALRAWQAFSGLLEPRWREQLALTGMDARQFWRCAIRPRLLAWTLPWLLAHPLPALYLLHRDMQMRDIEDFARNGVICTCLPGVGWLVVLLGVLDVFARMAAGSRNAGAMLVAWTVGGLATPLLVVGSFVATNPDDVTACAILAGSCTFAAFAVCWRASTCWRSVFVFDHAAGS